jgi:hypothetical protein
MITLTEQEVKDLVTYINGIPTQYGFGLLQFLNAKAQEVPTDQSPSETEEMDS